MGICRGIGSICWFALLTGIVTLARRRMGDRLLRFVDAGAGLGVPATSRASIGVHNTEADVDALISGLAEVKRIFA